jgi:hypothetical protein
VAVIVALALAFLFGAADQYLGSFSAHPWAADVSLLSAPWLVIAFVAGWTQRDARRGALLGAGCTFAALLGYGLMTLSPVENAHLTLRSATGFVRSERFVFIGAVITGPLFGWLGARWRSDRATVGALVVAGLVCLEPLAHVFYGYKLRFVAVSAAEVAVGLTLAAYVAARTLAARRAG